MGLRKLGSLSDGPITVGLLASGFIKRCLLYALKCKDLPLFLSSNYCYLKVGDDQTKVGCSFLATYPPDSFADPGEKYPSIKTNRTRGARGCIAGYGIGNHDEVLIL